MSRIAIDTTPLQTATPGGIGTSLFEILKRLASDSGQHDLVLMGTQAPVVPFSGEALDLGIPQLLGEGALSRSNIAWIRWSVASILRREGVDLFWGTRQVTPATTRVGRIVTIHDFWFKKHPEQQPVLNSLLDRTVITSSIRDADRVVAISESTARDARQLFGLAEQRVTAVPLGVDMDEFAGAPSAGPVLAGLGVPGAYLLSLDVYNPRKNFERVLQAYAALPEAIRESTRLVGIGRPRRTAVPAPIGETAARLGVTERLTLLDDVTPEQLRALYRGASALAYPSVYEGFGMPVLEAMASGCPVVTANASSIPEVAGDAALLVDPLSVDEIAGALTRVLGNADVADDLRARGLERAALFGWDRTVDGLLAVFDSVLAERDAGST